ncbi:NEL-type E3 ubiquitin ligase domain-containing protein [Pseudomonas sp. Z4-20]|uniref:NEL-type E3 ubiquitin ligase domain-containing protein n=1 Tax=Pseudomonas sp. Z4-20 TaxID=2817414 RepID=UPI003DA9CFF1
MSPSSTHTPEKAQQTRPRATESLHAGFLETAMPAWLIEASTLRKQEIKQAGTQAPAWYRNASPAQRKVVDACFKDKFAAQTQLDKTLSTFQDIDSFARPLLRKALKDRFKIEVDVDKTQLSLRRPLKLGVLNTEVTWFELFKLPLLQAALHNFERWECDQDAYHESSRFVVETDPPGTDTSVALDMSVGQFLTLCRTLDIGAKYQAYLKSFFYPADATTDTTLRQHFIASQKTALRAAAEQALLAKDIEPKDYAMIRSVIKGQNNPWIDEKPVWFEDMTLMKQRLVGCIAFSICEMHRYSTELILYVPHDPVHPLKRYNNDQLDRRFKQLLTTPDTGKSQDTKPTSYQRFFSQFVPYDKRPYFFSQFVQEVAGSSSDPLSVQWLPFVDPFSLLTQPNELPPKRPKMQRNPAPYIATSTRPQEGRALWADNLDLWTYLYDQHRERVLADARSHAVPTNDVDVKTRAAKLAHLEQLGLFAVNMLSMFVPVLGEVMMTVMAGQLLYETLDGAVEWGEGDKRAAKAHLVDVAQNLAMIGVMAGAGAGFSKLVAIKPEPVIERLQAVTLPNGEIRLWRPDLSGYESAVTLDGRSAPNALGQYEVDGKTYIRQGGKAYEQFFDESIHKWRVKHPTDTAAYQPILVHNGTGAWRHSLERPMTWDRLTLLRRIGHETAAFSDEVLLRLADISGVSDDTLRKMHMDRAAPPPGLRDAMRLFKADAEAGQVAGRLHGATPSKVTIRQPEDFAQPHEPAIFDSLYYAESTDVRIRILQRECPGLGEAAAQEVIAQGSSADLARLDATRRTPLKMLEEARWYARQGRQVRAYARLRSDNITSADSRRLALRALERLPGWPDAVRLEVREESTKGVLLDSIGDKYARETKYLIKNGPRYQAFNERGETLDSIPRQGDNFYGSLLQTLPDDARSALGLSRVDPSGELQRKIIDYADSHHEVLTEFLEPHAKRFKPPVRISATLKGYYASGRGRGMNPSLEARVEALYPEGQQAQAFIRQQRGKTDQQIYSVLQTRQREWDALSDALDQWRGAATGTSADFHKNQFVLALKDSWRNGPLAQELPEAARLALSCEESPPAISADFSHVRELSIVGSGLTDANADAFLAHFPGVTKLSIGGRENAYIDLSIQAQPLTTLPQAVGQMPKLINLRFTTGASMLAADFPARLTALTSLEALHIYYSGFDSAIIQGLDLTPLSRLRTLKIEAPYALSRWPDSVQSLPQLERLDLTHTSIHTLPEAIFEGHEKLWSGLSLDWSKLTPEAFKRAYRYVSSYSGAFGHLVDLDRMVDEYCHEQLQLMIGRSEYLGRLPERFKNASNTPQERFDALETLRAEHDAIFTQFYEPTEPAGLTHAVLSAHWREPEGGRLFRVLRNSWTDALHRRFGLQVGSARFELPPSGSSLATEKITMLPVLPTGSFSHVRTLNLGSLDVSLEQARNFFRAFSGTLIMDISDSGFTELPFVAGDLPALRQLDMRNNNLLVQPALQAQFNDVKNLVELNLENNPLNTFDVSALTQLRALNLKATQLQAWPTGAEHLSQLAWLDLRDNQLRLLPSTVLSSDEVLLKVNLTGNPFSPEGEAALGAARQRVEHATGLPQGALARFAQETIPLHFPPSETGWSIAQLLLPLPEESAVAEGDAGLQLRLQRVDPSMTSEQAALKLEQWRRDGMTNRQIDAQISQWHQARHSLTRQLNGWIFTRQLRQGRSIVSSQNRVFAAKRIRDAWQEGLTRLDGAGQTLSLHGLQLGDLPQMVERLPGVTDLDLSGVLLSEQGSNGFLASFPHVNQLNLSSNGLSALPDAVLQMNRLEYLEVAYNNLAPETVYPLLANGRLRGLNLRSNGLDTFDPADFGQLETLDLSDNEIEEWPQHVLSAQHLRVLNLSSNALTDIPEGLLNGNHDALVAGTDLSHCEELLFDALWELRSYSEQHNRTSLMGLSLDELDSWIAVLETGEGEGGTSDFDDSEGEVHGDGHDPHAAVAPVEPLLDPSRDTSPMALEPWLVGSDVEQTSLRSRIWTQLAEENDHERFFQLIALLQDTFDFRFGRAELTRRVWNVMEAAGENSELRQLLFQNAETHGTCIDGRILTFSELEVRVFVYQALRDIPQDRPILRGQALLRLSRQLFRLDRVDTLAEVAGTGTDRAEMRLRYRIGLTTGWGDGIDLPAQPSHMAYGAPITGARLAQTRASILEAEQTDALLVSMVSREYWTNYLHERYPEQMSDISDSVAHRRDQLLSELEDRRADGEVDTQQYNLQLNALSRTVDTLRTQKLVELTRRELNDLRGVAAETEISGNGSPQPGPSHRN